MANSSQYLIPFPALDEWGTPLEKLPDCPRCGEDELGVIHPHCIMCYACGWEMLKLEDVR